MVNHGRGAILCGIFRHLTSMFQVEASQQVRCAFKRVQTALLTRVLNADPGIDVTNAFLTRHAENEPVHEVALGQCYLIYPTLCL